MGYWTQLAHLSRAARMYNPKGGIPAPGPELYQQGGRFFLSADDMEGLSPRRYLVFPNPDSTQGFSLKHENLGMDLEWAEHLGKGQPAPTLRFAPQSPGTLVNIAGDPFMLKRTVPRIYPSAAARGGLPIEKTAYVEADR